MASIQIRINGREYQVACDDGQEEHLTYLAEEVNGRVRSLVQGMGGNPGEVMALVLSALMMADELVEYKKEIKDMRVEFQRQVRLMQDERRQEQQERGGEAEQVMAATLEEVALRIERIADQLELQ